MKLTVKGYSLILAILLIFACSLIGSDLQAMPPVARTVLKNHFVLLHSEDHSLPFVTLQLLIDAGSAKDPNGKEGLAYLTASGLMLGTALRTQTDINEKLDFLGASLESSSGRDYAVLSLRVLKKDLDEGLALLQEVFTQPAFQEKELLREKDKTLARILSEEDRPEVVAEKGFMKTLFASGPYRHPSSGTKETIPEISREDVLNFYRTYYNPNNCILAVVGDIGPDEVKNKLVPMFDKQSEVPLPHGPMKNVFSDFSKGPVTLKIDRPISQANIVLGSEGVSRDNPDFYALRVMNYILGGGGFASRLLEEIRNKRGLAYSVESFFDPGRYVGSFQIVLQTKNSSAREAVSLAVRQMTLMQETQVSEKELEGAKKYLIGSFPMLVDTQAKLAGFMLQEEYYGLGQDYPERYPGLIQAVTREDILRVAKTYLHPEQYALVIVGDLKEAGLAPDVADPVETRETSNKAGAMKILVQKIIDAYGGKTAVNSVKSVYAAGKINAVALNDEGMYVRYFKKSGKLRVDIKYTRSSELRILNGAKGYESIDSAPISGVEGNRYLAMAYQYKQLDLPGGLLENKYRIGYEGKAAVNNAEAEVISLNDAEGPLMKVYVDSKSFHIIKVSGYFPAGDTTMVLSAEFSDFRKVDGTILPFKVTNFANGQKIADTVIEKYRINPEMSEALFSPSEN